MATHVNVRKDQEAPGRIQISPCRDKGLWNRMVLASSDACEHNGVARPASLAAAAALHAVEAASAVDNSGGTRAVPSAGSIYPYEFFAVLGGGPGDQGHDVVGIDPVRRLCWNVAADDAAERCRQAGVTPPPPGGALLVLVTRPWLSMRKYGDRGYLYTQLDAAHMAVNVLGSADRCRELLLRFNRGPLEELLGLRDRCREVHSVLRIEPRTDAVLPRGWTVEGEAPASGTVAPSWLERACWESLTPRPPAGEDPLPCSGTQPLTSFAGSLESAVDFTSEQWDRLSRRRRSSKRYVPAALPAGLLAQVLRAAGAVLRTDLPPEGELGVTLLGRAVEDMPALAFRLTGEPVSEGGDPPDGDLIVRACMQQDHLRESAAFVVFHAPRASLVADRTSRAEELFFRAGGIAQLLYLGATEAALGVTAVGGFDTGLWRTIVRLPEDHDPVYVLSFGTVGTGGVKWDRTSVAYAQSER